jgi:hypothetical protein
MTFSLKLKYVYKFILFLAVSTCILRYKGQAANCVQGNTTTKLTFLYEITILSVFSPF